MASLGRFIQKYIFSLYIKRPSLEWPFFTIRKSNKMAAILLGFRMAVSLDHLIYKEEKNYVYNDLD